LDGTSGAVYTGVVLTEPKEGRVEVAWDQEGVPAEVAVDLLKVEKHA
jgi:hypothetical protein